MQKMTCDLRDKWTANLRSGEFKQGTSHLKLDLETPAYCCLGVLCVSAGVPLTRDVAGTELLPPPAYRSLYRPQNPVVNGAPFGLSEDQVERLWKMNDGTNVQKRATFPEIADWIETNVECE